MITTKFITTEDLAHYTTQKVIFFRESLSSLYLKENITSPSLVSENHYEIAASARV